MSYSLRSSRIVIVLFFLMLSGSVFAINSYAQNADTSDIRWAEINYIGMGSMKRSYTPWRHITLNADVRKGVSMYGYDTTAVFDIKEEEYNNITDAVIKVLNSKLEYTDRGTTSFTERITVKYFSNGQEFIKSFTSVLMLETNPDIKAFFAAVKGDVIQEIPINEY